MGNFSVIVYVFSRDYICSNKINAHFLGALTNLRKVTISFVMSVYLSIRPSVRPSVCVSVFHIQKLGSHQADFRVICYLRIFRNYVGNVRGQRLHNEELNDLYSSPNIVLVIKSRRMRWVGHVARMGEESGVYRVLLGKPEGKRPLGRPRRRWVDNIRMNLQERDVGIWTGLGWPRIETGGGRL